MTPLEMVLELLEIIPGVLVGVGVVLLFRMHYQQREEQLQLLRDLEVARIEGQRWRWSRDRSSPGWEKRLMRSSPGGTSQRRNARWRCSC
jgi:hypothetical protein